MRVIGYARVSTGDQSTEAQAHRLRAWAEGAGVELVELVADVGTGATTDRAGLVRLEQLITAGGVDAVAVVALDRLSRGTVADTLAIIERWSSNGVGFVALRDGIDTTQKAGAGRIVLAVMAAVAELERELIRERTREGVERARRRGKQIGRKRKPLTGAAALALVESGMTIAQAADAANVSPATFKRRLSDGRREALRAQNPPLSRGTKKAE